MMWALGLPVVDSIRGAKRRLVSARCPSLVSLTIECRPVDEFSHADLAGSEKHTSSKERNAEGKHINQSFVLNLPV